MKSDSQPSIQTAQLVVSPATGEVSGVSSNPIRLSPVNMRVLMTLLNNAENMTSRQQLFNDVWPNQMVSDDTLTKCISDLRTQLKPLTTINPLISTLPKKGYRWISPVHWLADKTTNETTHHLPISSKPLWVKYFRSYGLVALTLLLLSWAMLATIQWYTKPTATPLVILPTQVVQSNLALLDNGGYDVTGALKNAAMQHEEFNFLSHYAIQSHQGSPFPYFEHEFGVRWFIESEVHMNKTPAHVTLNLVDAKTALVVYSVQQPLQNSTALAQLCEEFMAFIAEL